MNYRIRRMVPEDSMEAAKIDADIFSVPWSENSFRTSLESDDTIYLAAVDENGKLLGYCGLLRSFEEADITNVAVRKEFRGYGIGESLLKGLIETGNETGIQRFTLEVRVSNEPAIRLYEKLGFDSVGIRKNFYDLPKEDAEIMWKYK